MDGGTVNVGHYFGGTFDGKTTGAMRAGSGGVQYRKDFTLNKKTKPVRSYQPASAAPVQFDMRSRPAVDRSNVMDYRVWRWLVIHFIAALFYMNIFFGPEFWTQTFMFTTVASPLVYAAFKGFRGMGDAAFSDRLNGTLTIFWALFTFLAVGGGLIKLFA